MPPPTSYGINNQSRAGRPLGTGVKVAENRPLTSNRAAKYGKEQGEVGTQNTVKQIIIILSEFKFHRKKLKDFQNRKT